MSTGTFRALAEFEKSTITIRGSVGKGFFKAYSRLAGKIKAIDKIKDEEKKRDAVKILNRITDDMQKLAKLVESSK